MAASFGLPTASSFVSITQSTAAMVAKAEALAESSPRALSARGSVALPAICLTYAFNASGVLNSVSDGWAKRFQYVFGIEECGFEFRRCGVSKFERHVAEDRLPGIEYCQMADQLIQLMDACPIEPRPDGVPHRRQHGDPRYVDVDNHIVGGSPFRLNASHRESRGACG